MKVNYDDREFDLDLDEMDVKQARTIKVATGMTVMALQKGMVEADPDALVGLYWYMMVSNGEKCNIRAVNFKIAAFANALADAVVNGLTDEQKAELEEATGVDLTGKSGSKEEAPKEST